MRLLAVVFACCTSALAAQSRPTAVSVLAQLGFPDTARVLIVHGDDLAASPAATEATLAALRAGGISSASIIATTPFLGALKRAWARDPQPFDLGVHLTLNSETKAMRWRPAAARKQASSLVDADGFLRLSGEDELDPWEVENELRAQVARVRDAGLPITHLDSHQGALLFHGAERFGALRRVARAYCLRIPVPESYFARFPYLADALDDGQLPLADLVSIGPEVTPAAWESFYRRTVATLRPGVTLLLLHLGTDSDKEQLLFREHVGWNAAWRARDAQVVQSGALRAATEAHGVTVIRWSDFARAAPPCTPTPSSNR